MNVQSTVPPRAQSKSFTFPQLLALVAAGLLATASIITNVSSAIARHHDLAGKMVSGSIALATAILATIGLAAALAALARRQYLIAMLAALGFTLAVAFSVSSALGVIGGGRLQASITNSHVEAERTRLRTERRNAVNDLATIPPQRSAAEITPELSRRLSVPGVDGCALLNGPMSRQHCPVIAALQSELAMSNRRSAVVGLIAQHDRDIAALGAPTIANRDAAAIAHVLAAVGFTAKADAINVTLMILSVLVLECGAALSLATATALRSIRPAMKDITLDARISPPEAIESVPAITALATADAVGAAKQAADKVVALVRDAGGELHVPSKRELARMTGSTTGSLHRGLAALAGIIVIATTADGLALKLVA